MSNHFSSIFGFQISGDTMYTRLPPLSFLIVAEKIVDSSTDNAGGPILRELKKKLDATVTLKQELEARLAQYYQKMDEYQMEVKGLRDHVSLKDCPKIYRS